jgi:acyl-CoA synthetase (AMP-forming)/AMP-acid ligase II
MATVASPLRQFYEWSTRDSGRAVALSWHPAPPQPVRRWSYRRLWLAAVGAAAKLRSRGAVPSDSGRASSGTIGVAVDEGVELVVAFLAVALAGAAIVPFSGSDPPARIASILRDADCRAVVVDSRRDRAATARVEEAARQSGRALTLVEADELVRQLSAEGGIETDEDRGPAFYDADANANAWDPDPDPRRVSHVAFTSGSAGKPRGCVCTHESLAHYCHGKNTTMGVRPDSTVLLASAHTFDPCLGDVFATLAAGATLALAPRARLAESLGSCLFESGATHALTTPTMLGSVCADQIKRIGADRTLEVLALGGEPMSQTLANAWLPNVKCLANAYGLTECGVYQTFSRVEHVCDADRIGDPIGPGCRLLVAELRDGGDGDGDAEFGAADAADAAALLQALAPVHRLRSDEKERLLELWIAGPQVGIGYARDAAATARRFFVDARTNERFFRTGDLVRVEDAPESSAAEKKKMCLRFAGRREAREFKLNGRRVDAREIEKAVLSSGLVSSCACVGFRVGRRRRRPDGARRASRRRPEQRNRSVVEGRKPIPGARPFPPRRRRVVWTTARASRWRRTPGATCHPPHAPGASWRGRRSRKRRAGNSTARGWRARARGWRLYGRRVRPSTPKTFICVAKKNRLRGPPRVWSRTSGARRWA